MTTSLLARQEACRAVSSHLLRVFGFVSHASSVSSFCVSLGSLVRSTVNTARDLSCRVEPGRPVILLRSTMWIKSLNGHQLNIARIPLSWLIDVMYMSCDRMPTIYNLKGENLSQSLQLILPPSFYLHISHHSPSTILFTGNSISLSGRPCLISLEVQTA